MCESACVGPEVRMRGYVPVVAIVISFPVILSGKEAMHMIVSEREQTHVEIDGKRTRIASRQRQRPSLPSWFLVRSLFAVTRCFLQQQTMGKVHFAKSSYLTKLYTLVHPTHEVPERIATTILTNL